MSTVICSHIHSVPRWQHLLTRQLVRISTKRKLKAFYILVAPSSFCKWIIFNARRENIWGVQKINYLQERKTWAHVPLIIFRSMTLKNERTLPDFRFFGRRPCFAVCPSLRSRFRDTDGMIGQYREKTIGLPYIWRRMVRGSTKTGDYFK
jgi:hypothetical protein